MLEQNVIIVTAVFILLQFFFTCVFFFEKHRQIKGMWAFTVSALLLLVTAISSFLYSNTLHEFYLITSIFSFSAIYYFVIRSFIKLLNIRSNHQVERFYFVIAVALIIPSLSADAVLTLMLGIVALAIIPLVYLLRLIATKVRYLGLLAERTFVSHCLSLIAIGYAFLVSLLLLDTLKSSSELIAQYVSFQLTASLITVCLLWILCAHISLLIAFLIVIYKFKLDELKKAGETDYLTGVYNRKAFFEKLSEIRDTKNTYFILIDADFFKKINDQYGHVVGDEALKHIASVVQTNISKDDLLARYGGEEFIVAVVNSDESKLKTMVERVRSQMERTPLKFNGMTIPITLSIGVSKYSKADILQNIEVADTMLYQAKNNGRNQAVFSFN